MFNRTLNISWRIQFSLICGLAVLAFVLNPAPAKAMKDFAAVVTNASNYDNWTRLYYVSISTTGNLGQPSLIDSIYAYSNNHGVAVADFDNDGDYDIILPHAGSNTFYLYRKTGAGASFSAREAVGTFFNQSIWAEDTAVSDFNNDRNMDFAFSDGDGKLQVYLGNGDGTFGLVTPIPSLGGNAILIGKDAADVNNDGFIDIVTASQGGDYLEVNFLQVWLGNGDGTFQNHYTVYQTTDLGDHSYNPFGWGVVTDDYNSDGEIDILFTKDYAENEYASRFYLMVGNGDGTFQTPVQWGWQLSWIYMPSDRFPYNASVTDPCPDVIHTRTDWAGKISVVNTNCAGVYTGYNTLDVAYDLGGIATPRALPPDTTGPAAYWMFDEGIGSMAYDSSGNIYNNDGTIYGATWTSDSISGYALSFDGSADYVYLDDPATNENPTFDNAVYVRTGEFWYKANQVTVPQMIYEEGGGKNGLNVYLRDSKVWVGAWSETSGWDGAWLSTDTTPNEWHHVVYVFDYSGAGLLQLYHDGAFITETTAPIHIDHHHGDDAIGGISGKSKTDAGIKSSEDGFYFDGLIDEAAIYDYTLTAAEINARYTR